MLTAWAQADFEPSVTLSTAFTSHVKGRLWLTGQAAIDFALERPIIRGGEVAFQLGAEFKLDEIFFFGVGGFERKYTANYGCHWAPGAAWQCEAREFGPETNVGRETGAVPVLPLHVATPDYARFGERSAFHREPIVAPILSSTQAPVSSRVSTVLNNVFPGASPTITEVAGGLLLLWVDQDPTLPPLQSTDILWSFYDGRQWSNPEAIFEDTQFETSPVAAVDANGEVVVASGSESTIRPSQIQ